ncbi:MAG: FkbM family methyltransferase [Bryobacteraceae bacterium]
MVNFSAISNSKFAGRALRLPLRLVPSGAEIRILQGPLRGKRWIVGASSHGCWLGSYELPKQRVLSAYVKPGMVCWDIGANAGYYTLLFAQLAGQDGRVFSFEPLPHNLELLRRHVEVNAYRNVRVLPCALGDRDGEARFDPGPGRSMGRLSDQGQLSVACWRADTLLATGKIQPPDVIKIDVEGAEAKVLLGAKSALARGPVVFLATHGDGPHGECLKTLAKCGYLVKALTGSDVETSDEVLGYPREAAS